MSLACTNTKENLKRCYLHPPKIKLQLKTKPKTHRGSPAQETKMVDAIYP